MRKKIDFAGLDEVPREVIEKIAAILGSLSASAIALKDADAFGGRCKFYLDKKNQSVVVEKLVAVERN